MSQRNGTPTNRAGKRGFWRNVEGSTWDEQERLQRAPLSDRKPNRLVTPPTAPDSPAELFEGGAV